MITDSQVQFLPFSSVPKVFSSIMMASSARKADLWPTRVNNLRKARANSPLHAWKDALLVNSNIIAGPSPPIEYLKAGAA